MIELFQNTGVVVGTIVTVFGAISGVIYWLDKRNRKVAENAVSRASGRSDVLHQRVVDLEGNIQRVAQDVGGIKQELDGVDSRVHAIEKSLETVARQQDVSSLNAQVQGLAGSLGGRLDMLTGMMHSFRESALRASEKGEDK